jgi:hypothetical protein
MKKINLKITAILLVTAFAVFYGCIKKDIDSTPYVPHVTFNSNKSIKSLIAGYEGGVDTIKEDWVIKGVITANDESGNFYKTLYLQDDSAAINIQIDRTSMFNEFKVGQVVYIKLQGLCLGNYGGMIQIGYPYIDAGSLTCGRIPDVFVDDHLFRDGLPGNPPTPKYVQNFNSLTSDDLGKLVKFTGVIFETPCEIYSFDYTSTNNNIIDNQANIIVLRTSNYANFRASTLPNDTGTVIGIYSTYNGAKQFAIRDLNDVIFAKKCETTNLINEGFASGTLGVFKQYSVLGNAIWQYGTYGGKYYATISGYETSDANEDWLISPPVNLDLYSEETLIFQTATKYSDPTGTLKLYYSSNYSGTGTPTAAAWTEITGFNLSSGNFTWVSSGNIDLSSISGNKVYFAYKYTCTATNTPTWELTNIKLRGKHN